MFLLLLNCCSCSGAIVKNFPSIVSNLISGSEALAKFNVNSFSPLKTDKKINKAVVLAIIPREAMAVIMFMALFLLRLIAYRLAIYKERFNLRFLSFF